MSDFVPTYGEKVELELVGQDREDRPLVVLDPFDGHKLKTGDRVRWSTYFARRQADGALVPKPFKPGTPAKKSRAPRDEGEST